MKLPRAGSFQTTAGQATSRAKRDQRPLLHASLPIRWALSLRPSRLRFQAATSLCLVSRNRRRESTGSTSPSSGDGEAPPVVKRWRRAKVEASDQVWYVHTVSGMLHLVASPEDVPMMLACGRPVNANYRKASRDEVCNGAECRTCRRNV